MADLRQALIDLLTADQATLMADLVGGVYGLPLGKETTPEAFSRGTGRASRLLPSAVVQVSGVGASLAGGILVAGLAGVALGASRAVTIWLYEPSPGREVIERAKFRVIALLKGRGVLTDNEGQVVLAFIGDLGDGPVDTDLNASVEQVRFRAATMIGREAAA